MRACTRIQRQSSCSPGATVPAPARLRSAVRKDGTRGEWRHASIHICGLVASQIAGGTGNSVSILKQCICGIG